MDLNQLLFHHQIALMRDASESGVVQFGSRFDMASHYRRRIIRLRREMGVARYPSWMKDSSQPAD